MFAVAAFCLVGLTSITVADVSSRNGSTYTKASVFFWLGLLVIFVPIAVRVLMPDTPSHERIALVICLSISLYIVKILASPHAFTFSDEYVHLQNTQEILRTHHLFAANPLLPTAAYYPGLAAITAGLVDLTGLSTFVSGLLVIGVGRALFAASFYLVTRTVTKSDRAAGGASLVYIANPMFLFFSSTFSYENLGLPLAAFAVWWIGRTRQRSDPAALVVASSAIVAVTVTHHIAGFALSALLVVWGVMDLRAERPNPVVALLALLSCTTTLVWFFVIARPAASYLFSQNLFPALRSTGSLLVGHTARRHLYASGGLVSPRWESAVGFLATGLLLLALVLSLRYLWRGRAHTFVSRTLWVAAGIAVAYPLSLIPRLAPTGVAISGRSAEYIFTGLGCLVGLLAAAAPTPPGGWHARRSAPSAYIRSQRLVIARHRPLVAAGLLAIVFVGNITVGTAFYQRLPEATHPQGYPWLVQPDVITASTWARQHLGINQRFGANAIDSFALAADGQQDTVAKNDIWPVFFAPSMNATVVQSLRTTGVRYLLVDWRMTKGVPPSPGYYFSPFEPNAGTYKHAFPPSGLRKFSSSNCVRLIYTVGAVQIFDVSRIENGSCVPPQDNVTQASQASG